MMTVETIRMNRIVVRGKTADAHRLSLRASHRTSAYQRVSTAICKVTALMAVTKSDVVSLFSLHNYVLTD